VSERPSVAVTQPTPTPNRWAGGSGQYHQIGKTEVWALPRATGKYAQRFPGLLLERIKERIGWEEPVLFVCSGLVKEGMSVDMNPAVRPTVLADACHLPFADSLFGIVICDPPYDESRAAYWGYPYPRPNIMAREAARVTRPEGLLIVLHWLVLITPPEMERVAVVAVTNGPNMRIRALNAFRKLPGAW